MSFTSEDLRKEYPNTDLWMPGDPTNIVAFDNIPENLILALQAQHGELRLIHTADQMEQYLTDPDLRLILGRSELKIENRQLDKAKSLAMLAKCCIGTDGLNFAMAADKGVVIVNSRQAANSVAEMAVEFALGVTRNTVGSIIETCIDPPEGKLRKRAEGRRELRYMKVGIMGAGQIGSLTAKKMAPLAKEILLYDDAPNAQQKIGDRGIMVKSLDELLHESDIIIIHADDTDNEGQSNANLITAERLKDAGVFAVINLAREEIATVAELAKAIENGYIKRARTDVHPKKNEAAKDWVCTIPPKMVKTGEFVGTAHIGASTEEVQEAIGVDVYNKWNDYQRHRNIRPGQNFSAKNFIPADTRYSIVFQHSNHPGTIGILGDALGGAGINADASITKDIKGTPRKGTTVPLEWGLTRFDVPTFFGEASIGTMLEELKKRNGGFELHRVAVIDRGENELNT